MYQRTIMGVFHGSEEEHLVNSAVGDFEFVVAQLGKNPKTQRFPYLILTYYKKELMDYLPVNSVQRAEGIIKDNMVKVADPKGAVEFLNNSFLARRAHMTFLEGEI